MSDNETRNLMTNGIEPTDERGNFAVRWRTVKEMIERFIPAWIFECRLKADEDRRDEEGGSLWLGLIDERIWFRWNL
jgi:hypothetical protein